MALGGGFEGTDDQFGQKGCISFGEFLFSFIGGFEIFQSRVMPPGDGAVIVRYRKHNFHFLFSYQP